MRLDGREVEILDLTTPGAPPYPWYDTPMVRACARHFGQMVEMFMTHALEGVRRRRGEPLPADHLPLGISDRLLDLRIQDWGRAQQLAYKLLVKNAPEVPEDDPTC